MHQNALFNLFTASLIELPAKSVFKSTFACFCNFVLYICKQKSSIMHFESIIKQLKSRRETLQVTQDMLAELSGVSVRALKQFESGKGNPTLETLSKLANALGMEVSLQVKTPKLEA